MAIRDIYRVHGTTKYINTVSTKTPERYINPACRQSVPSLIRRMYFKLLKISITIEVFLTPLNNDGMQADGGDPFPGPTLFEWSMARELAGWWSVCQVQGGDRGLVKLDASWKSQPKCSRYTILLQ